MPCTDTCCRPEYKGEWECQICGAIDEHTEDAHGEPVILFETGRDTVNGFLVRQIEALRGLLPDQPAAYNNLTYLIDDDENGMETLIEIYDQWEARVQDAGFHVVNDPDGNSWQVYGGTETTAEYLERMRKEG